MEENSLKNEEIKMCIDCGAILNHETVTKTSKKYSKFGPKSNGWSLPEGLNKEDFQIYRKNKDNPKIRYEFGC
jgi:hypothetical protein